MDITLAGAEHPRMSEPFDLQRARQAVGRVDSTTNDLPLELFARLAVGRASRKHDHQTVLNDIHII